MHKISFAPVLSATLSRDSCWIIPLSLLLGLLDDVDEPPALGGAQRASLHDPDPIPHAGAIGLIVCLEPRGLAEHLAVEAVLHPVLDRHDNGLVHLVADDVALPDLSPPTVGVVLTHLRPLLPVRLDRRRSRVHAPGARCRSVRCPSVPREAGHGTPADQ